MAGPKDRIAEDTHEDKEHSLAPGKPGSPTPTTRSKTRTRRPARTARARNGPYSSASSATP
eukprot:6425186-Prymnesium_polylepis.1